MIPTPRFPPAIFTCREFVKAGMAAGGVLLSGVAHGNRHPVPRPTSLVYLDRNMYRRNTDVLAVPAPVSTS